MHLNCHRLFFLAIIFSILDVAFSAPTAGLIRTSHKEEERSSKIHLQRRGLLKHLRNKKTQQNEPDRSTDNPTISRVETLPDTPNSLGPLVRTNPDGPTRMSTEESTLNSGILVKQEQRPGPSASSIPSEKEIPVDPFKQYEGMPGLSTESFRKELVKVFPVEGRWSLQMNTKWTNIDKEMKRIGKPLDLAAHLRIADSLRRGIDPKDPPGLPPVQLKSIDF